VPQLTFGIHYADARMAVAHRGASFVNSSKSLLQAAAGSIRFAVAALTPKMLPGEVRHP
jgi:hypothetical protein